MVYGQGWVQNLGGNASDVPTAVAAAPNGGVLIVGKTESNVFILDNLSTGFKKLINKKAKFIKGNVGDYIKVRNIITKNKINSIIHLAAHFRMSSDCKYYTHN